MNRKEYTMFRTHAQSLTRCGEYDHGNGRRGTHPYRHRIAPGAPAWVRIPLVEPVVGVAHEQVERDDLYGKEHG